METDEIIKEAFLLGFMISREGFNAECAYDHCCDGLKPDSQTEAEFRDMVANSESFQDALGEAMVRIKQEQQC